MYISTRNEKEQVSAKQALKQGVAPDGGLYVLPDIGQKQLDLKALSMMSYQQLALQVLQLLLPGFTSQELTQSVAAAYGSQFSDARITPLKTVGDLNVLELFHGPTAAFKDIGLQLLPQLLQRALTPEEKVMILAATSGDTGKAALAGFQDVPQTGITTFYPAGGVSAVQARQMRTAPGQNVAVAAVQGNFDAAQTKVKALLVDPVLKADLAAQQVFLSSANSINIGRLIPQTVYYFSAYFQLVQMGRVQFGEPVNFVVPTGNFGDVLAGYYAKCLGLPVAKLVAATNANSEVADFLATGRYDRNRPFLKTTAPSMDIQVASNLERLLYAKSGSAKLVAGLMKDLNEKGTYQVDPQLLAALQADFAGAKASDDQIQAAIKDTWQAQNYLIDPHTAAGLVALRKVQDQLTGATVLLSTASAYKFPQAVGAAILPHVAKNDFAAMAQIFAATKAPIPKPLQQLEGLPVRFQDEIAIDEMNAYVQAQVKKVFA